MDSLATLDAFKALSQETRLDIIRLLVKHGNAGLPVQAITDTLGIRQNLVSTHLATLSRAALVAVRREGKYAYYRVNFDTIRALGAFLLEDCCSKQCEQAATFERTSS